MTHAEQVSEALLKLYNQWGDEAYDGEPVTQTSHMIQAAMLALQHNADNELVLGAFLHDVGHLLKYSQPMEEMGNYGVVNHESIGATYLKQLGFSERVCAVVNNHVNAKRYLVATDEGYKTRLSTASFETLKWQGGPMSYEEAQSFRSHPYFTDIIKVRLWDEGAKDRHAQLLPLTFFKGLLLNHLDN